MAMRFAMGAALVFLAGCAGLRSNVSHAELTRDYRAEFVADGDTLILRVRNRPGLNIVRLVGSVRNGDLHVGALRASSGPRAWREVSMSVAPFGLGEDWDGRVYWVDPDGRETKVDVVRRP